MQRVQEFDVLLGRWRRRNSTKLLMLFAIIAWILALTLERRGQFLIGLILGPLVFRGGPPRSKMVILWGANFEVID